MFPHMKNLLSIVFLVAHNVSSVMRSLVPLDSTYASPIPRTPQKLKKCYKKCSSDYFHIVHVVERIALVWNPHGISNLSRQSFVFYKLFGNWTCFSKYSIKHDVFPFVVCFFLFSDASLSELVILLFWRNQHLSARPASSKAQLESYMININEHCVSTKTYTLSMFIYFSTSW